MRVVAGRAVAPGPAVVPGGPRGTAARRSGGPRAGPPAGSVPTGRHRQRFLQFGVMLPPPVTLLGCRESVKGEFVSASRGGMCGADCGMRCHLGDPGWTGRAGRERVTPFLALNVMWVTLLFHIVHFVRVLFRPAFAMPDSGNCGPDLLAPPPGPGGGVRHPGPPNAHPTSASAPGSSARWGAGRRGPPQTKNDKGWPDVSLPGPAADCSTSAERRDRGRARPAAARAGIRAAESRRRSVAAPRRDRPRPRARRPPRGGPGPACGRSGPGSGRGDPRGTVGVVTAAGRHLPSSGK